MSYVKYYTPKILNPKDARTSFNPRYIDIQDNKPSSLNPDADTPYHEVDEFVHTLKVYNFSHRICHLGLRDGSVVTLRNTLPNELEGRRCYLQYLPRKVNGVYNKPLSEVKHQQIPKIEEGIYFCLMKQVSTSTKSTNKGTSSLLWQDNDTGYIVGSGYNHLLKDGLDKQDNYKYNPIPDLPDYEETGYLGPTYYAGEPDIDGNSRTARNWNARRYYETMYIEYFIPIDEINNSDKRYLYIDCLDVVLSTGLNQRELIHPYSVVGKQVEMENLIYQGIDREIRNNLGGVSIINVDNVNQSSVNQYYTNLGGHVISIKSVRDERLPDGVYFHLSGSTSDDNGISKSERIFMSHSEALSHSRKDLPKLYRTFSEAFNHGDVLKQKSDEEKARELERQEKLNEMKQQLLESQANVDKLKLELEEARLKRKDEYDERSKRRDDYYDDRSTRRDDYYDERSSSRKDSSEAFKWILGIGGIALGVVLKSVF